MQRKWQGIAFNYLLKFSEKYGDPCRIIAVKRKEIKHWPQIKTSDVAAYQKFQNFLEKLDNIGHLQIWNVLNTTGITCMLLQKWSDSAGDKYDTLRDLILFDTICVFPVFWIVQMVPDRAKHHKWSWNVLTKWRGHHRKPDLTDFRFHHFVNDEKHIVSYPKN